MYLTRLQLDPRSGYARRDLGNPYDMHRTLARAFTGDAEAAPDRFLWRLQIDARWEQPEVLVQSERCGAWAVLESMRGYLLQPAETKPVALNRWLGAGQQLRFRLRANPVVSRGGKRFGLVGEAAQLTWLEQRGDRHGFRLESAMVTGTEVIKAFKGQTPITLRTATFDGVLQCADQEMLRHALLHGVGHGKAFGLGMLSVAPAGTS